MEHYAPLPDAGDDEHARESPENKEPGQNGEGDEEAGDVSPHARRTKHTLGEPLLRNGNEAGPSESARSAWTRSTPLSCHLLRDTVTPCTRQKFYGRYELTGVPEFFLVEEACNCNSVADLPDNAVADKWEATYETYGTALTKIHAAHLAASMGNTEVMKWLREHCETDILDLQAILQVKKPSMMPGRFVYECTRNYTPLMSAMFMSQVPVAIWLLQEGASATTMNSDGLTPLHMLAWNGLPHISDLTRTHSITQVAKKLVEKKADLLQSSGSLPHRKDPNAKNFRNKTPLELAAGQGSTFPKQMLHLLTQSYHFPAQSALFEEVAIIAKANPQAAVVLLGNIQTAKPGTVQEQLRKEVIQRVIEGSHMEIFIETLKMSPVAGAKLLSLLMGEPKVADPQRYSLPIHSVLRNREMICTCQPVELAGAEELPVWKNMGTDAAPLPLWHREFKKDLPSDPLLHQDVYEVKVKVLYFPGILNTRVLAILSMVWQNWDHMQIFYMIPIRALITGMWNLHRPLWIAVMAWKLLLLAVLVVVGLRTFSDPYHYIMLRAIIISTLITDLANLASSLVNCERLAGIPRWTYLKDFAWYEVIVWIVLSVMPFTDMPPESGRDKVILAVNIMARGFGIMSSIRVFPQIGTLIIAVLHSFEPMWGMFNFMGMMFMTLACTFLTMKDEDRSVMYVIVNLYQALFLTDSDGAEAISGIDLGDQQTLDFGIEMFQGSHDEWLLNASTLIMLGATSVFSLVLLNLTIGMYTKYYEQMEPFAKLSFQQFRARMSVRFALRARLPERWLVASALRRTKISLGLAALVSVLISFVATWKESAFGSGFALAVALLLGQASLQIHGPHGDNRNQYLWVSYRSDFNEDFYRGAQEAETLEMRAKMRESEARQKALRNEVRELSSLVQETHQALLAKLQAQQELQQKQFELLESQAAMQKYVQIPVQVPMQAASQPSIPVQTGTLSRGTSSQASAAIYNQSWGPIRMLQASERPQRPAT